MGQREDFDDKLWRVGADGSNPTLLIPEEVIPSGSVFQFTVLQ